MLWILAGFLALAVVFLLLSRLWRAGRPRISEILKVSILIPAYKSEKTIRECLESVKGLDYPNKEIIVVNDYPDGTPEIAKSFGFTVINNGTRQGKAKSLNDAVKKARGDVLFFLDSDTIVSSDCLRKIMPWFSDKRTGIVAPRYVARNGGLVPRLVSLENSYNSTMFRMHMLFGSMVSFRGCGVAIRRDAFERLGGWSHTLIEDTDFAARANASGYRIRYEPSAVVETYEPAGVRELKKQKLRWGRGAGFAILNNKKAYAGSPAALFQFLPYVLLNMAILWTLLNGLDQFPGLLLTIFASVTLHNFVLMFPERRKISDALYLPVYTVLYLPVVLVCYVGGILIGMKGRIGKKPELDFRHW